MCHLIALMTVAIVSAQAGTAASDDADARILLVPNSPLMKVTGPRASAVDSRVDGKVDDRIDNSVKNKFDGGAEATGKTGTGQMSGSSSRNVAVSTDGSGGRTAVAPVSAGRRTTGNTLSDYPNQSRAEYRSRLFGGDFGSARNKVSVRPMGVPGMQSNEAASRFGNRTRNFRSKEGEYTRVKVSETKQSISERDLFGGTGRRR